MRGVEVHVGELGVAQGAVPERVDTLVEPRTDPADFGLGDAVSTPIAATRSSTERVDTPLTYASMITALCVQGLVDTAARLEELGEERAPA